MEGISKIKEDAIKFAKENKKKIAKNFADITKYPPQEEPISIFMAGAPGAGKTEISKRLIKIMANQIQLVPILRIDCDELRKEFKNYSGNIAYLFQGAASILVDKIHDLVLAKKQNFLLDGTLSNKERAIKNISRSLDKNRETLIFFVYDNPLTSWDFVKKREKEEKREIPKEAFIEHYFDSINTIKYLNKKYKNISIIIIKNDLKNQKIDKIIDLEYSSQSIDELIENRYTKKELTKLL